MGSFSVPLSGLKAAQDQLQAVSNNLANSNTTAYKDSTLTFSSLFSAATGVNGSGNPVQTGSGVKTAATDTNFAQGNLSATGSSASMAISGNGFFVTKNSLGELTYTRAGDFTPNPAGQLVAPNGELLLGYPASGGVVNTSASLRPLQVNAATIPAVTTTDIEITANLNANAAVGDTATSTLSIYDSLGGAHALSVTYIKNGTGTWNFSVDIPNSDLTAGGAGTTQVASGSGPQALSFDSSGKLVMPGTPPATSIAITISPTSTPPAKFVNGAAPMVFKWNLNDANGNPTISQTAASSSTSSTNQNGFASGTLNSYSILADGTIEGAFSSGQNMALGQVAVANFANNQGLVSVGDSNYHQTNTSGNAVVGSAGTGGRGLVVGGSVELSNVDIATEFAKLIVAQQAYSANAKAITTFTQVSQVTMAMVQ
jgi:flagellar hook protein FlgE